jgi:hypothetical protein
MDVSARWRIAMLGALWIAGLVGCESRGACVAGGGAGPGGCEQATFVHCDDGVASNQCNISCGRATFYEGKSCADVGYAIPCTPPAAPNCFLNGRLDPSDAAAD